MDILILGNGFDLAHDLPTKYSDFLNYCRTNEKCKQFCYNNVWIKHFLNKKLSGDKWIDLEEEIYNVIVKLSELPYFRNNTLSEQYQDVPFWISKSYYKLNFDECRKYFRNIDAFVDKDDYYVPVKNFIPFLYDQLRDFTKVFNYYLKEVVEKKIEKSLDYDLCLNSNCVSLLNFNYTDTCERLYKKECNVTMCGINTQKVYIHGKICNNNDCNLILGTKSFSNEKIPVEFNIFKKHHQRHKYGTIELYQELLKELRAPKRQYPITFHIIGHSLDEADHSILKHILTAREKSTINIYYHTEEAQNRMMNNINLIIGEEEVMTKVRFIHQHNDERSILKLK